MTLRPFDITQGRYRATSRYRRGIKLNNGSAHPAALLGVSHEQSRKAQGHKVAAIVPAAGSGKRFGSGEKKPFVLLAGKPLIIYALKALDSSK